MFKKRTAKIIIACVCAAVLAGATGVVSACYSDRIEAGLADQTVSSALLGQKQQLKRTQQVEVIEEVTEVAVGDSYTIEAEAQTPVTYESDNEEIATVDEEGTVTCTGIGQATITITAEENGTYEEEQEVVTMDVAGLEQEVEGLEDEYEVAKEESFTLEGEAETGVTYRSEDEEIATVDEEGTVTGVGEGTVKIIVTADSDGVYEATEREVTVNVSKSLAERQQLARQAAVDWGINIANDNSFHYGEPSWAHHNGCYFCGTNQEKGSIKRKAGASVGECEKTYCCNPFVTACFAHGAEAPEVDCRKHDMRVGLSGDSNKVLKNEEAFEQIEKPADVTELEVGDILLTPTHAMLYAGDGYVVEAAHHDNGKENSYWDDSIRHAPIKDHQWKRVKLIYRYIGVGKF